MLVRSTNHPVPFFLHGTTGIAITNDEAGTRIEGALFAGELELLRALAKARLIEILEPYVAPTEPAPVVIPPAPIDDVNENAAPAPSPESSTVNVKPKARRKPAAA